jgi:hypothetical protein
VVQYTLRARYDRLPCLCAPFKPVRAYEEQDAQRIGRLVLWLCAEREERGVVRASLKAETESRRPQAKEVEYVREVSWPQSLASNMKKFLPDATISWKTLGFCPLGS